MPTSLHFAALSGKPMAKAVAALEPLTGHPLPIQAAEDWSWVTATLADGTALTLTRTDDFDTIAGWVDGAPTDVNWQLIVQRDAGLDSAVVDRVCRALDGALGTRVSIYQVR